VTRRRWMGITSSTSNEWVVVALLHCSTLCYVAHLLPVSLELMRSSAEQQAKIVSATPVVNVISVHLLSASYYLDR
jgi:hypothetical protein